jgi:hypothetical protein
MPEPKPKPATEPARIDVHTHAMSNEAAVQVARHGGYEPTGGYQIPVRWTPEAALAYGGRPTMERPVALRGWRPASYRHWPFRCGWAA